MFLASSSSLVEPAAVLLVRAWGVCGGGRPGANVMQSAADMRQHALARVACRGGGLPGCWLTPRMVAISRSLCAACTYLACSRVPYATGPRPALSPATRACTCDWRRGTGGCGARKQPRSPTAAGPPATSKPSTSRRTCSSAACSSASQTSSRWGRRTGGGGEGKTGGDGTGGNRAVTTGLMRAILRSSRSRASCPCPRGTHPPIPARFPCRLRYPAAHVHGLPLHTASTGPSALHLHYTHNTRADTRPAVVLQPVSTAVSPTWCAPCSHPSPLPPPPGCWPVM